MLLSAWLLQHSVVPWLSIKTAQFRSFKLASFVRLMTVEVCAFLYDST